MWHLLGRFLCVSIVIVCVCYSPIDNLDCFKAGQPVLNYVNQICDSKKAVAGFETGWAADFQTYRVAGFKTCWAAGLRINWMA